MTPEEMADCAAGGRFWWMRPDGTFYGSSDTDEAGQPIPADPKDMYLLDASEEWIAQWESWEQAVEVMTPLFAQLNRNEET